MNQLAHLLKLTQEELKMEVYNFLQQKNMKPIFEDGFVYAKGDIPILLVAHLDTVFDEPPKRLYYSVKKDKFFNPDGGLGGDDRCGVYVIMKLLEKYRPYVLFTEDEEIGCIGARKAVESLPNPRVKYIIEFDRKGSNDCVFYKCGNEEFKTYIESFGFITAKGSCSDISVLGKEWDTAAVNLSCGYYEAHTENEYIIFEELQNNINRVESMLTKHKEVPFFDFQEIKRKPKHSTSLFGDWSDEELEWLIEKFCGGDINYSENGPQAETFGMKFVFKKDDNNNKDN